MCSSSRLTAIYLQTSLLILELRSNDTKMKVSSTLKSIFRKEKNNDRVYIYKEESGHQNRSTLHKFYSAIELARKPKRRKYNPLKFAFNSLSPSSPDNSPSSPSLPHNLQTQAPRNRSRCDDVDLEDGLEVITLGDDLPPNPLDGEPWDPLAIVIAWEYPEEEMPVFLDFHYMGYGY